VGRLGGGSWGAGKIPELGDTQGGGALEVSDEAGENLGWDMGWDRKVWSWQGGCKPSPHHPPSPSLSSAG